MTGFVQVVVADDDAKINAWLTGLSGWQGWLVLLAPIAILAANGVVRRADRDRLASTPDGPPDGRVPAL